MKKIKLSFKNECDRDAFYERVWCRLHGLPQCDTCGRNKRRYENWEYPNVIYQSFGFSNAAYEKAKAGCCPMFDQASSFYDPTWREVGRLPKQIQPVRFRPYTYEEAKKLLGKVMEVPEKEGLCGIDLICSVSYDRESGDVLINGECFKSLSEDGCLIDGVPIGVPEVDEEALKGGVE